MSNYLTKEDHAYIDRQTPEVKRLMRSKGGDAAAKRVGAIADNLSSKKAANEFLTTIAQRLMSN